MYIIVTYLFADDVSVHRDLGGDRKTEIYKNTGRMNAAASSVETMKTVFCSFFMLELTG